MTRLISILCALIFLFACAYCVHELPKSWHPMWVARATISFIGIVICAAVMACPDDNDPGPV